MKFTHFIIPVFFLSLALAYTGCSSGDGGSTNAAVLSDNGPPVAAFNNLAAFVTAPGSCVQCHSPGGAAESYPFAVPSSAPSDCSTMISTNPPLVNLASPSTSLLAINAGNGHCGVSICGGGSSPVNNTPTITNFITAWAAAVASGAAGTTACTTPVVASATPSHTPTVSCPIGFIPPSSAITYTTSQKPIPSPLPLFSSSTGSSVSWTFTSSTLMPANSGVSGAVFNIQIQNDSPNYQIILPRMLVPSSDNVGGSTTTTVKGLHVLINGCEWPNGTWTGAAIDPAQASITGSTLPNPIPTPLPSTAPLLSPDNVLVPQVSSSDMISIGFETLSGP